MRQVQVLAWCDVCADGDTPATVSTTFTVDGERPRLLDLCLPHHQEHVLPFLDVLGKATPADAVPRPAQTGGKGRGRPTLPPEPGQLGFACPLATCSYVGRTRRLLAQHAQRAHRQKLTSLLGKDNPAPAGQVAQDVRQPDN